MTLFNTMNSIMQTGWDANIIPIGVIVGLLAILAVVWNASRKVTTLENDAKTGKEQHNADILRIENKISDIDKTNIQRYSDSKIERKEEIAKELSNQTTKFETLQRQVDSVKSDVKTVASTVTEVNTKVRAIEKDVEELKECDIENRRFFEKWIQRKEDDIKEIMTFLLGKKMMIDRHDAQTNDE